MHGKARVGRSYIHPSRASLSLLIMEGISPESHFSLIEEARNTERHHSWNSDLKLRHSRIVFVSAGATKADDLIQTRQERVEERSEAFQESVEETRDGLAAAIGKHLASANIAIVPEIPLSNMSLSDSNVVGLDFEVCDPTKAEHMREGRSEKETASSSIFFTDFNGSEIPYTGLATPAVRHTPSSDASDSSEEVILFAGRRASKTRTQEKLDCSRKSSVHPFSESTKLIPRVTATVIEDSVGINLDGATSVPEALSQGLTINTHTADSTPFRKDKSETFGRRLRRRRKGERPSKRAEYDAEIVADYIANLSDNEELNTSVGNSAYNRRDLGGSDDQWQDDEKAFAVEQQVDHGILSVGEWDSAYLRDFDDLSTSSEALDTIEQILLKRERISGLQYLVLGKGCTVDDARWLPISMLKSLGADEQVRLFEEEQAECEQLCESSEDSRGNVSRDEQLAMNLHGDLDDLGNERDLKESGREIMTDEQIARVLAKQEELGLGSNDLLLLDGEGFANNGMEDVPLDGSWGPSLQPRQRPKQKKGHRDGFPSATFIADVLEQDHYNGFDVIDQDRASLHRRAKGRRGKPALELSDSEVEQAITVAWENDRTKKKIRKQEREEFRVRGLLGKGDKVDMKAKYSEGMSMDEVKYEIREFLSSTLETYINLDPLCYCMIWLNDLVYPCRRSLRKNAR